MVNVSKAERAARQFPFVTHTNGQAIAPSQWQRLVDRGRKERIRGIPQV
jgi:hypothetical protein